LEYFSSRDMEWSWKFRLLDAEIITDQGLSKEVLSLLEPPIPSAIVKRDLSVRRYMLRALAFAHLGFFKEANHNLSTALQFCERFTCESSGKLAEIAGAVNVDENQIDEAQSYFRSSLQISRQRGDHFLESSALLNMGVIELWKEHFDEAISWSQQSQLAARAVNSGLDEEKALGNMGWAYYKLGDFERALASFNTAVQKARQSGVVIDEVEWLNNVGLVNFQTGEFSVAEQNYRRSLDLAETSKNSGQILDALTSLAFLSIARKETDSAVGYATRASGLARERKDQAAEMYTLLARAEIAALSHDSKTAGELFLQVAHNPASDMSARWEAQNSLGKLYENENRIAEANKAYRQALATVENARSSIQHEDFRLPFLTNAAHLYDDYIHFLISHGKVVQALQAADYSRAQTLEEGLGLRPAKDESHSAAPTEIGQIARRAKATILFYWLGPEHSYLWAVSPEETKLIALPSAAEIAALVEGYDHVLTTGKDPLETENADGAALYDALVKPIEKLIRPNSRVIVIPDGSLNRLDFETLLVPKPKLHYWIDDVTVLTATSLRLLSASRQSALRNGKLLLIGDPVVENPDYGALPNASLEIKNIEKHFPAGRRQVYVHEQATPSAYLESQPERFSLIHFVAHGTASTLSPLDSSVVLSKNDSADSSFKLYARDVIAHPLQADLVTISSCYGAGTRFYTGEGLIGLSWSFLRAGARNVIGALWAVSDTSTPEFMDDFYSELAKGRAPATALHDAKLHMLHSNGVFRKPFYWAPFQLYTGG
jgi:CHAT domain-containing protein